MSQTRLTIGIPVYDDFDGAYFTINALRLYHAEAIGHCELVVVDNHPVGPQAARLAKFVREIAGGTAGISGSQNSSRWRQCSRPWRTRYIPFAEFSGTAGPRNLIFREAIGDAVLILDSHVQLWPGTLAKLLQFLDEHPGTCDLLQGPQVQDNLQEETTHLDDVWRGGRWGTEGIAWRSPDGLLVSPRQSADQRLLLVDLLEQTAVPAPGSAWNGHEFSLEAAGYHRAAEENVPLEIPAQRLGLFACRRDAWPGLSPLFREYGGEEWYIHSKVRRRGAKVWCLPWLKWLHRSTNPLGDRRFPRSKLGQVRNYLLGHRELGLPLDRLYRHFVVGRSEDPAHPHDHGGTVSQLEWDHLVKYTEEYPITQLDQLTVQQLESAMPRQLAAMFHAAAGTMSELFKHCHQLRELAAQSHTVVEFGQRPSVSTIALLAGQPQRLFSIAPEPPVPWSELTANRGQTELEYRCGDSLTTESPECDLLFLDGSQNGVRTWQELIHHRERCRRYIVLHDTERYGLEGEDKQPGLLTSVRRFVTEFPEWSVVKHTRLNFGLTVLSCRTEDRPDRLLRLWPLGFGPGTELKQLLESIGITPSASCNCNSRVRQMDEWGVDGCQRRRNEIVKWLHEGQSGWGWSEKLAAATKALTTGLAFHLNPLDPFASLVDEAIRRAVVNLKRREESASDLSHVPIPHGSNS